MAAIWENSSKKVKESELNAFVFSTACESKVVAFADLSQLRFSEQVLLLGDVSKHILILHIPWTGCYLWWTSRKRHQRIAALCVFYLYSKQGKKNDCDSVSFSALECCLFPFIHILGLSRALSIMSRSSSLSFIQNSFPKLELLEQSLQSAYKTGVAESMLEICQRCQVSRWNRTDFHLLYLRVKSIPKMGLLSQVLTCVSAAQHV